MWLCHKSTVLVALEERAYTSGGSESRREIHRSGSRSTGIARPTDKQTARQKSGHHRSNDDLLSAGRFGVGRSSTRPVVLECARGQIVASAGGTKSSAPARRSRAGPPAELARILVSISKEMTIKCGLHILSANRAGSRHRGARVGNVFASVTRSGPGRAELGSSDEEGRHTLQQIPAWIRSTACSTTPSARDIRGNVRRLAARARPSRSREKSSRSARRVGRPLDGGRARTGVGRAHRAAASHARRRSRKRRRLVLFGRATHLSPLDLSRPGSTPRQVPFRFRASRIPYPKTQDSPSKRWGARTKPAPQHPSSFVAQSPACPRSTGETVVGPRPRACSCDAEASARACLVELGRGRGNRHRRVPGRVAREISVARRAPRGTFKRYERWCTPTTGLKKVVARSSRRKRAGTRARQPSR